MSTSSPRRDIFAERATLSGRAGEFRRTCWRTHSRRAYSIRPADLAPARMVCGEFDSKGVLMIRRRSKRWQAIVNYRDRNGRNHQLSKTVDTKADALAAEAEFRRQATRARPLASAR
jgi:hypothetical protein